MHKNQNIDLIGVSHGWGAQRRETEQGPSVFEHYTYMNPGFRDKPHFRDHWTTHLYPAQNASEASPYSLGSQEVHQLNLDLCQQLAEVTNACVRLGGFPMTIGGDHLIAAGTWSGIIHALDAPQHFGLIWIDAHMDAHTPETSPSQAYHGMPLALLLGHGDPDFVQIDPAGAKLSPQHVSLIGIRSFESGEQALLEKLGVRIYYMAEVHQRGFDTVFQESVERARGGTKGFGVSIDLDAFDPQFAPGVGSPEPHGLIPKDVFPSLALLRNHPDLRGFEITEYNPTRDHDHKTAQLMWEILHTILSQEAS